MVNGYYDFATGTAFIPYLGAGIGVSRINVDASLVGANRVNSSGTGFGLQGIAGVGYQLDDNWTGSLEYRYYTPQDVEVNLSNGSRVDADYNSYSIMVGLRYTFGEKKANGCRCSCTCACSSRTSTDCSQLYRVL